MTTKVFRTEKSIKEAIRHNLVTSTVSPEERHHQLLRAWDRQPFLPLTLSINPHPDQEAARDTARRANRYAGQGGKQVPTKCFPVTPGYLEAGLNWGEEKLQFG